MSHSSPNRLMPLSLVFFCLASWGETCLSQSFEREYWYGVLKTEGRHFRFVLQVDASAAGQTAQLTSLDEGAAEFPLDEFVQTDQRLEFKLRVSGAVYSGAWDAEAQAMQGAWSQRGGEFELSFKEVTEPPKFEYQAVWQGRLKVLLQSLDVQIRELVSGEIYFDSLSQKAGGFVASKEVDGQTVTVNVPAVRGKFTGELSADGKQIDGKWSQGLITTQLVLERVDVEAVGFSTEPPPRPQTPQAPFPYAVEEVTFENATAGVQLSGTLTLPADASEKSVPAVVLISGSGPQDRDETILGHKPFWVIADHLSRQGIAVLRYDERGVGKSTGDFSQATSVELADDVQAAVAYLQSHPHVDSKRIGLCGHSEGGLVGPMVAVRPNAGIAFVVMLAGPGVSGRKIIESQSKLILEKSGVAGDELDRQQKIQQVFLDLAEQDPALTREQFMEQGQAAIAELLTEQESEGDTAEAMVGLAAGQLLSPWMRYFLTYEPKTRLQQLQCPVLVLNGEKDVQVDPDLNLPAIRSALEAAGNEDVTIRELPDLNHLFQHAETGLIQEYELIEETFDLATLELLASWILERRRIP